MIVGLGQFGRCLLEATARAAHDGDTAITIVDRDAEARLQAVLLVQPGLAERARIDVVDIDLDRPDRDASERLRSALARDVTTVAVCFDDDARAVTTALMIRRLLGSAPTRVIARTSGTGGLSLLLGQGATAAGVTPFPLLERACTREIVEGGAHEQVARALHADYTDRTVGTPYDVPWDELPPDVQESNRRQADALAAALAVIGCDLVPLGGWGVSHVELTPDEVEVLARREHERWFAERTAAGWRYGPERDNDQRVNPLLVSWDELPEDARENGREAARRIPAVLALAGLEVLRMAPVPVSPAPAG
jgi:Trk K+ transport system NAD-binding subunit